MNIFMIGGTGLLGIEGAKTLLEQGHEVSSISYSGGKHCDIPEGMVIHVGDYMSMSDEELVSKLTGVDAFVFATGKDERECIPDGVTAYDFFAENNIYPLQRLIKLAKESGVKKTVVLGSYFAHFNRELPELELYKHHPYIRSRIDQANMALSFADENMDVSVLEIPYVYGVQKGRAPIWTSLVGEILKMKDTTFYSEGGTSMVTAKQVGQAIAGAVIRGTTGNIPVGYYNMEWTEMLEIFHKFMGTPGKPIFTIPTEKYMESMKNRQQKMEEMEIQAGLNFGEFAKLATKNLFINKSHIEALGVQADDIEKAIGESVLASMEILEEKQKELIA